RFYAGAPLIHGSGHRLGTLCTVDMKPRRPSPAQIGVLQTLASIAADALTIQKELRETSELLSQSRIEARDRSLFLASFGHELRTPLTNIIGFAEIIENGNDRSLPRDKCRDYAGTIRQSAHHLFQVIDGIVRLEKAAHGANLSVATTAVDPIVDEVLRS